LRSIALKKAESTPSDTASIRRADLDREAERTRLRPSLKQTHGLYQ